MQFLRFLQKKAFAETSSIQDISAFSPTPDTVAPRGGDSGGVRKRVGVVEMVEYLPFKEGSKATSTVPN